LAGAIRVLAAESPVPAPTSEATQGPETEIPSETMGGPQWDPTDRQTLVQHAVRRLFAAAPAIGAGEMPDGRQLRC
jgi:hypothetical protein